MAKVFSLIALFSIPVIILYRSGGGINFNIDVKSRYGLFSIANLGMDTVNCAVIPFVLESFHLKCPYGKLGELKSNKFGINTYKSEFRDACIVDESY